MLVLRYFSPMVTAQLNGAILTFAEQPDGTVAANISGQLPARNELTVSLEPPCPAPMDSREAILEAALEIHPAA